MGYFGGNGRMTTPAPGAFRATVATDAELDAALTECLSGAYDSGTFFVAAPLTINTDYAVSKDLAFIGINSDATLDWFNGTTIDGDKVRLSFIGLILANSWNIGWAVRCGQDAGAYVFMSNCSVSQFHGESFLYNVFNGVLSADLHGCTIVNTSGSQAFIDTSNHAGGFARTRASFVNCRIDGVCASSSYPNASTHVRLTGTRVTNQGYGCWRQRDGGSLTVEGDASCEIDTTGVDGSDNIMTFAPTVGAFREVHSGEEAPVLREGQSRIWHKPTTGEVLAVTRIGGVNYGTEMTSL